MSKATPVILCDTVIATGAEGYARMEGVRGAMLEQRLGRCLPGREGERKVNLGQRECVKQSLGGIKCKSLYLLLDSGTLFLCNPLRMLPTTLPFGFLS